MRNDRENVIVDLSFKFSLKIIQFVEILESQRKFVIARQLLKSGTSIGANIREAQNAESKADFINKCKIVAKEADKTEYGLQPCKNTEGYPFQDELLEDINSLIKIISKNVGTSKRNSI